MTSGRLLELSICIDVCSSSLEEGAMGVWDVAKWDIEIIERTGWSYVSSHVFINIIISYTLRSLLHLNSLAILSSLHLVSFAPMSTPNQPLISTKDPQNLNLLAGRILWRPIPQDPSQSLVHVPRSRGASIPVIIRLHLVIRERLSIILIRNNCQLLFIIKSNECARFRRLQ